MQLADIRTLEKRLNEASEQSMFIIDLGNQVETYQSESRGAAETLAFEILRAGIGVSRYVIVAAYRESPTRSKLNFGLAAERIWDEVSESARWNAPLIAFMDHALLILSAFAGSDTVIELTGQRGNAIRMLRQQLLIFERADRTNERLRVLASEIGRLTEYDPVRDASKARAVWARLESVVVLPPASARIPSQDYFPSLAEVAAGTVGELEKVSRQGGLLRSRKRRAIQSTGVVFEEIPTERWGSSPLLPPEVRDIRTAGDGRDRESELGVVPYRVWFGTDRRPRTAAHPSRGFTNEPDPNRTVRYGSCLVNIPLPHRKGTLGPSWMDVILHPGRYERIKLDAIDELEDQEKFTAEIRSALSDLDRDDKTLLLYVHGYATTFEQAALRTAQIGFDLETTSQCVFFSWPSWGLKRAYFPDRERISGSEQVFAEFLRVLIVETGATRVNMVVHSMGNQLFARAVHALVMEASGRPGFRMGRVVLAAPDVDVVVFKQLSTHYGKTADAATLYVSSGDRALDLSQVLQKSDRAGFSPPVTVIKDVDTVDATGVDLSLIGHGYFSEVEEVIRDMKLFLEGQIRPAQRSLRAVESPDGDHWAL